MPVQVLPSGQVVTTKPQSASITAKVSSGKTQLYQLPNGKIISVIDDDDEPAENITQTLQPISLPKVQPIKPIKLTLN